MSHPKLFSTQLIEEALKHCVGHSSQPFFYIEGESSFHQNEEKNQEWVVTLEMLEKMVAMAMGQLPVKAIALPKNLLDQHYSMLKTTQKVVKTVSLSRLFSPYLTAALYELQSLCRTGNIQAYMIGGQVRDVLLRCDHRFDLVDVDITVESNAIEAAQFLVAHSKNFMVDDVFPEFGTVTLIYKDNLRFDLASTRQEYYEHCGSLPTIINRGVDLSLDVVRRDFTVNTLAMPIHHLGQVLDYTGGLEDLENQQIRILHPLSFYEDPSRILRALRFASRLGFKWDELTELAARQCLAYCHQVYSGGGDRIRSELWDFLAQEPTPHKARWLNWFIASKAYQLIATKLDCTPLNSGVNTGDDLRLRTHEVLEKAPALLCEVKPLIEPLLQQAAHDALHHEGFSPWQDFQGLLGVWLLVAPFINSSGALDDETSDFRQLTKRLELTRYEREWFSKTYRLVVGHSFEAITESTSPVELYEAWHRYPLEALLLAVLTMALLRPELSRETLQLWLAAISRFERRLRPMRPFLNGDDLRALGLPEGAAMGQMLTALLHQKLMGHLQSADAEEAYVRELIANQQPLT
ncbi:MAG: hypothetical protein U0003_04470 [Vampirovibrionales bacterium]